MLPVLSDLQALLRRLASDERDRVRELASLESRIRRFEDVERPAYERWRYLAFGPSLSVLQELYDAVQARRALAQRVMALVEREDLRPREALYVASHGASADTHRRGRVDPDAVEARRRAKRERKRERRKEATREQRASTETSGRIRAARTSDTAASLRIVTLYRALARRLHPDSPTAIRSLDATRIRTLWCEVQSAYEGRSLERLLAISAWLETAEEHGGSTPPHLH